jgi:hypothetical protein
VFSDEFADMERQAMEIAGWGNNGREDSCDEHEARTSYELKTCNQVEINVTA